MKKLKEVSVSRSYQKNDKQIELEKLFQTGKSQDSTPSLKSLWVDVSSKLLANSYQSLAELLPDLSKELSDKLPMQNLTAEEQTSAVKEILDLNPDLKQELTDIFKLTS